MELRFPHSHEAQGGEMEGLDSPASTDCTALRGIFGDIKAWTGCDDGGESEQGLPEGFIANHRPGRGRGMILESLCPIHDLHRVLPAPCDPKETAASSATKNTGHFSWFSSFLECCPSSGPSSPCADRKDPSEPMDVCSQKTAQLLQQSPHPPCDSCLSVPSFTCSSKKSDFSLSFNFPFITHKHPTRIFFSFLKKFLFFQLPHNKTISLTLILSLRQSKPSLPQKAEWSDSVGQGLIQTICPVVGAD